MNTLAIHTRLTEIIRSARIADSARLRRDLLQLSLSVDVIELHLQAIKAELKSPQADANAERARLDWSPGWNLGPEQDS
jgi:hypothetical protein